MIYLSKAGVLMGLIIFTMAPAISMRAFAQTSAPTIEEGVSAPAKQVVADDNLTRDELSANKSASVQYGAKDNGMESPPTTDIKTQRWYQELRNGLRSELLDDRAETIEWWLTIITIVLAFFSIGIPVVGSIAFAFSLKKFEGIKDQAQRYVDEIKSHRDVTEKSAKAVQGLASHMTIQASEKVEKVDENVGKSSEASLVEKTVERAISLQELGKRDEAIELWRSVAKVAEENDNVQAARAWFRVGHLSQDEDPEAGIVAYNRAIHLLPNIAAPYNNRGNAKAALARYEDAITDYDQAIRLKPNNTEPYYNRGLAKKQLGRLEAAVVDYDKAIQINRDNVQAYYSRGIAKNELGRRAEARQDFESALELARKTNNAKLVTQAERALRDLGPDEGA